MAICEVPSFISLLKKNRSLHIEYAVEALGGSEALYEKLVKQTIRMIPSRIESMDGFLGKDCDLSTLSIHVHAMKGSLNQMGCEELAMAAESLERAAKTGDRQYCNEHYGAFRNGLLRLHEEITAILPHSQTTGSGCISDYHDILCRAREAAEDYDSISAAESVSPLAGICFGEEVDILVSGAIQALECFQPEQALDHILSLIKICEMPASVKRGE